MAFLKDVSVAKPAATTTVAQAIEPTVTATIPGDDGLSGLTQGGIKPSLSSASSESTIDEKNPFSDPKVAKYYKDLYDNSQYECRDAFDPELEWSAAEEKKLVRKLDYRVCAFACFAFFALQVDRGAKKIL